MKTTQRDWASYAATVSHDRLANLAARLYFDTNARSLTNEDIEDWLKTLSTNVLVRFMNDHSNHF